MGEPSRVLRGYWVTGRHLSPGALAFTLQGRFWRVHSSEKELPSHGILRYAVTAKPGFPYRASHAIFVAENATRAELVSVHHPG